MRIRQAAFLRVTPMMRQILIVLGVAALSVSGFGLVLALCWLVASKVAGTYTYILQAHLQTMMGVLPVLCLAVALVGAGFALSTMTAQKETRPHRILSFHHRFRG